MTAENILYEIAGGFAASLLTTIFLCLVFYRTGPKRDLTAEIMEGLRKPTWKVITATKPEDKK